MLLLCVRVCVCARALFGCALQVHGALPVTLLRQARVLLFEPPSGLPSSLRHCLSLVPPARLQRGPVARSRLYLLLAWCHAVIQERLRYHPIGWTKAFEFTDTDFQVGLETLDSWLVRSAQCCVCWCFHFCTAGHRYCARAGWPCGGLLRALHVEPPCSWLASF